MSHSNGACRFKDNSIMFYEYDGTADIVISLLHENLEKVSENWRTYNSTKCNCGKEEEVEIYSDYGGGFYFNGFACKKCKSIRPIEDDFDKISAINYKDNWAKKISEFSIF